MLQQEYCAAALHSGKNQRERRGNLQKFKDGEVRFLICTDVAARGLDINELPYVINYTLPDKPEDYIHRIGRVGRADRMGLAISIVSTVKEKVWFHTCPSKGKNCSNATLLSEGGCGLWYDEMQYFKDIEAHIREEIPSLDQNYRLAGVTDSGVVFGQKKAEKAEVNIEEHLAQLKPMVQELTKLEDQVQLNYWSWKERFDGKH